MRWPFGRSYEVRALNRDARHIVEDAEARFSPERRRELARELGGHLDRAHARLARPGTTHENVLLDLQRLHREAKGRGQDLPLSALTLAIIYLRAERIGAQCEPAVRAIEALQAVSPEGGEAPETREA